jgi:hypothetical protein
MTCGDHMPGKSATGRNGKIPYYEHSWATKRESCLTKKTFKCDPTRVQAKKAEALVWTEFCRLLENEELIPVFLGHSNLFALERELLREILFWQPILDPLESL